MPKVAAGGLVVAVAVALVMAAVVELVVAAVAAVAVVVAVVVVRVVAVVYLAGLRRVGHLPGPLLESSGDRTSRNFAADGFQ